MNSIAVIIDPWKTTLSWLPLLSPYNRCYENIISFVDNQHDIDTVLLSSYDCKTEELKSNNTWYNNSRNFFGEEFSKNKEVFYSKNNPNKINVTDKKILNWIPNRKHYAVHYMFELDALVDWNELDRIYVMGQTWEDCVKHRPLGYEELKKFFKQKKLDIEIAVKPNTVLAKHNFHFNPKHNLDWTCEHQDIFIYDYKR